MIKIIAILACLFPVSVFTVSYETSIFWQKVNHYGVLIDERNVEATFRHKYLVVREYFDAKKAASENSENEVIDLDGDENEGLIDTKNHTIFLYTGGNAPIEEFYEKSGYVLDLAEYYGALVIFAEHRFYGESLPSDELSFPEFGLLTVDQAIADFANLLYFVKYDEDIPDAKVITFGTSYAGSLAAYMRFKYPNLILGALASGAPVKMADDFGSRGLYWTQVTEQYQQLEDIGYDTVKTVRGAFKEMEELMHYGPQGYQSITEKLNLCEVLTPDTYEPLLKTIRNPFSQMALHNFPYESDGFPAYPVQMSAELLYDAHTPLSGIKDLIYYYYGFDEDDCFDVGSVFVDSADQTGWSNGTDAMAWNFQLCWEINSEIGSDHASSMFANLPFTDDDRDSYCANFFKLPINQRHQWFKINYWGSEVALTTNIIWTNGLLDPWYGTGIIDDSTAGTTALGSMVGAAQGMDLRSPVEGDGLKKYRDIELDFVGQILDGTFPAY